jgi:omega-hydroxy-beta-dihydromenaquinone-9 sulfotransferase
VYFDGHYYWRVLRHVWSLRQWPGRNRTLARLLLQVPLEYVVHAIFFLLDYIVFPALWRQQVRRPVFIVGHARSGTTLAHRLLAGDGDTFSYFLYWEMFFPSLLQKKFIRWLGGVDERYFGRALNKRLVAWDDKQFGAFRHMHDMSLWNSEEDQFVMRAAFVTQQWSMDIPMMDVIDIFHIDQMPATKRRRWMRQAPVGVERRRQGAPEQEPRDERMGPGVGRDVPGCPHRGDDARPGAMYSERPETGGAHLARQRVATRRLCTLAANTYRRVF